MAELGSDSMKIHKSFKYYIEKIDVDIVFTLGKYMKGLHENLAKNLIKYHRSSIEEVYIELKNLVKNGDSILIKGSNSMHLSQIVIKMSKEFKNR